MASWMYILKCADGSFYVGMTSDIYQRLEQHYAGKGSGYTSKRSRMPVELVHSEEYDEIMSAREREYQVKHWTRAKKQALIAQDWTQLSELSRARHDARLPEAGREKS